ncbi:MAG TPA: sugar phosphate nucleotidyltransferase [Acidimicrobiales bacterium]|nr:sugar phosphate nucleotidyltransferase [Acidimicrobiales bacterium]
MARRIRTAVIPAGGVGTRMLPASSAVPKELLPVGRKPAIQWAINEALDAGIEQILVISSSRKPSIAAYFFGNKRSEDLFGRSNRRRRGILPNSQVRIVNQPSARGLGDAVRIAHLALGAEPFALLLPDEILLGGSRLLRVMLDDFERTGESGISLLRVDPTMIEFYGCAQVTPGPDDERLSVTACIEKPHPLTAPSYFAISGRYVLGPDVLDLLDTVEADETGEVQLTTALDLAASTGGLAGFVVREEDGRVDVGNWQGWQEANVRCFADDAALETPVSVIDLQLTGRDVTDMQPAVASIFDKPPTSVIHPSDELNGHAGVAS